VAKGATPPSLREKTKTVRVLFFVFGGVMDNPNSNPKTQLNSSSVSSFNSIKGSNSSKISLSNLLPPPRVNSSLNYLNSSSNLNPAPLLQTSGTPQNKSKPHHPQKEEGKRKKKRENSKKSSFSFLFFLPLTSPFFFSLSLSDPRVFIHLIRPYHVG